MDENNNQNKLDQASQSILEKLTGALQADGDFPVRAKVVEELREMVNDPDASVERITEVILREPSLGTRVLHLVNSAYSQRDSGIMTITQAVIQIGTRNLIDLCAGLVLMQKFVPATERGGIFADSLKKTLLTSLITSTLVEGEDDETLTEQGYLAGNLYSLSYLLLAFYFPQVYEVARRRASSRGYSIEQSITEVLGLDRKALSIAIVESLRVPKFYKEVIEDAENLENKDVSVIAQALYAADKLADSIIYGTSSSDIEDTINKLLEHTLFDEEELLNTAYTIPEMFEDHCESIDLTFLSLPEFAIEYLVKSEDLEVEDEEEEEEIEEEEEENDELDRTKELSQEEITAFFNNLPPYMTEVTEVIEAKEGVSSIITSIMETLAFGLGFERVVLLMADSSNSALVGKMALGKNVDFDPKKIIRPIYDAKITNSADIQAFRSKQLVYKGESALNDSESCIAIPIGQKKASIGVIYADFTDNQIPSGLDKQLEKTLQVLLRALDQVTTISLEN